MLEDFGWNFFHPHTMCKSTLPETNIYNIAPEKNWVGRWTYFWEGLFSGATLVLGMICFGDGLKIKTDIVFVGWFLFFVLSDRKGWRINWLRGGVCFARANKLFYPVILLLEEIRLTRWGWQFIPLYTSQVKDFFQQQYVCLSLSYWQTKLKCVSQLTSNSYRFF